MKYRNWILSLILLFVSVFFGFAGELVSNDNIKIIEKETYQIQIKQYNKDYPVILYVVFKNTIPPADNIKKILKKELLSLSKKENRNDNIIASAWFQDQISKDLQKIKLSENYSSFVWVGGKKRTIMTFQEYINFLKKEKAKNKKKEKAEKEIDK